VHLPSHASNKVEDATEHRHGHLEMKLEKEFLQEKAPHLKLRGTAKAPLGEAHATINAAPSQGSMPAASPLKLHGPKSFETCP
jgi:hypothetical protein